MGWRIPAWCQARDTRLHPRAKQAGHRCGCSQRDRDAAGSTTGLVTLTSVAGIHKLKIRQAQRGLSPFIFMQVTAWQPEAEDLSREAPNSSVQCCLRLVQAARGPLLRCLAWGVTALASPLPHGAMGLPFPRGCSPRPTSHTNASGALPHCCLRSDAGDALPSASLACGASPQPPGMGKRQAFA